MTEQEIKALNLTQKMFYIQHSIANVEKNLIVGIGNSGYKAVGDVDVLRAVKKAEAEWRVSSKVTSVDIVKTDVHQVQNRMGGISMMYQVIVNVNVLFENIDDPNDKLTVTIPSIGLDNGDKAFGKAITYGRKYALLGAYKIVTGEDPDAKASEDHVYTNTDSIRQQIEMCTTVEELNELYKKNSSKVKGDNEIIAIFAAKKKELNK